MTVAELIAELQTKNPNAEVFYEIYDTDGGHALVNNVATPPVLGAPDAVVLS